MGDVLKGIAALVLVAAAFRYAVTSVVSKAIANSDGTANGFQFECKPLEIPETNFHWNANWMTDTGVVWHGDRATGETDTPQARSEPKEPTRSYEPVAPVHRERALQASEKFEAMRKQHIAVRQQHVR